MLISRKEIVSILLLLTAIICVLNASFFANILPLHVSYEQLGQQIVCLGTAYICLIYALSTWLYHSNYSRTRLHMRLVLIAMSLVMLVCNIVSAYFFLQGLSFSSLSKTAELSLLFSSFAEDSRSASIGLSIISVVLLFVVIVLTIVSIIQKRKKNNTKGKLQDAESQ
ncbi:uncharacterized protein LOC108087105 [Drosophila ficusphila]|uniref:uncharacterized protein LOC108087105 n=1 Tax=Drosophila ficusphila TaxID=30025 RepID=UPI0007E71941|nr:uncharacterized protein LOC108087105 [Drosophila ficusphila]